MCSEHDFTASSFGPCNFPVIESLELVKKGVKFSRNFRRRHLDPLVGKNKVKTNLFWLLASCLLIAIQSMMCTIVISK